MTIQPPRGEIPAEVFVYSKEQQAAHAFWRDFIAHVVILSFLIIFVFSSVRHPFYGLIVGIPLVTIWVLAWLWMEQTDPFAVFIAVLMCGTLLISEGRLLFYGDCIAADFGLPAPPMPGSILWALLEDVGHFLWMVLGSFLGLRLMLRNAS